MDFKLSPTRYQAFTLDVLGTVIEKYLLDKEKKIHQKVEPLHYSALEYILPDHYLLMDLLEFLEKKSCKYSKKMKMELFLRTKN